MKVFSYSKALYSTWFYLEPLRLLLDAGEGLNTHLEGRLLAFRNIAITHAHTDHFTGLQNILVTRLREMEVTKEPMPRLLLMYPHDSYTIKRYLQYIEEVTDRFHDLVELRPVRVGDKIPLQGVRGLHLNVMKADHFVHRQTAMSYRIDREHFELKEELRGLPQQEINRRIAQEGRAALTNCVLKPLVFYSGDGKPVLDPESRKVPLMIHEATFLEPGHKPTHSSLPGVISLFRELEARQLLLFHLSTRYHFKEFMQELDRLVPNKKERDRISVVRPGSMYQRDIPVPGF